MCTLPEETCWGDEYQNGGLKNGRCDLTTKTCTCRTGYSGAFCTENIGITNVKTNSDLFGTAGVPFGESLSITWNSSTTLFPHVNIILTRTSDATTWPVGQYLATMIPNINSWSWSVGSVLQSGLEAGGGYQVRVWYSKNNGYGDSAQFSIADPCGYISCGAHGTCDRGLCQCSDGYSGQFCGTGPCERALCDTVQNNCTNDYLIASGQYLKPQVCPCSAGFTGAQCRTPFLCSSITCQNGGDLGGVVQTASSCTGKCVCRGNWIGTACETCGLTCQNGGTVNANCTSCDGCKAGFFGKDCSCQYYLLGFKFLVDVSGWFGASGNTVAQARWSRTLALDIITAVASVSPNKAAVSIDSITPQPPADGQTKGSVLVSVKLSLNCAPTSQMGGGAEDNGGGNYHFDYSSYEPVSGLYHSTAAFEAFLSRHLLTVTPTDTSLLATYNSFRPLLADTDSPAYQGQITSQADPTFRVTASDPSGTDALQSPDQPRDCFQEDCTVAPDSGSDDGLVAKITSSPLFIALISIGLVLIIGGIVFAVWYFRKRKQTSKDTLSALSRMGANGESELTANPVITSGRWAQL